MDENMVDWLHGFFSIAQKEYAWVAKFDEELYHYLLSGKKIAVKDVTIYPVKKYIGETKDD